MAYIKWGLLAGFAVLMAGLLHYALPQHDIVRITDIETTRMDIGKDSDGTMQTRDVRFIYAKYPDGGSMEFRNEDTGWGFPWYFKFDEAKLANEAADLKSTEETPRWVVVTHYGWRLTFMSMFPNALSVRTAEGPDETIIPWFSIVFIVLLLILLFVIYRVLFRRRSA